MSTERMALLISFEKNLLWFLRLRFWLTFDLVEKKSPNYGQSWLLCPGKFSEGDMICSCFFKIENLPAKSSVSVLISLVFLMFLSERKY